MILYNGKIYTMDKGKVVEAIKITGNKISKLGNSLDVLVFKDKNEECIDLKGKSVIPGFNDSHMHLYGFGTTLEMVDLKNISSIEEIISKVKNYIKISNIPYGKWVKGRGWNQDYFTNRVFPTRYDLDKISSEHPIILTRACGHMAVVNSKAIEICGLDNMKKNIEGGEYDLSLGIFKEKALSLILDNIPKPSIIDIKKTLIEAMKYVNSMGITSVQTDDLSHCGNYKNMLLAYDELNKENRLNCRIYEQCLLNKDKLSEFIELGYKTGIGDDYFKIGPLKILSDGSLGARTAALENHYIDDPSTKGVMCYTQDELDDLITYAHINDMQIATHCIGNRAMRMVLDSYEKAFSIKNNNNHRHGIIHCQITDKSILNRFKELNICAYIQPIFLHYDIHIVEKRVGKELASTSYAFKSMLNKEIKVSLGTDCPVESCNPFENIYCAVNRQDLHGLPLNGWNKQESLSVYDAVYHYTVGGAYQSFAENIKGCIKTNYLADFVVLSDDIFTIEPMKIKDIEVLMTFVGGKIVYKK